MRLLLRQLFGGQSAPVVIVHHDGQDWASVSHICYIMGISNEYHVVEDQYTRPELNLTDTEKRLFTVPTVHPTRQVWFVTESGLWKIIGRSRSPWAERYRASFFTNVLPALYRHMSLTT